jgi:protein-tyrosine phosphatase
MGQGDKHLPFEREVKPDDDGGPHLALDFEALRRMGGRNFRDLGGHPTSSGRRVRRGHIYRSAHLARVPDGSPLRQISLRTVVTLQSRIEVSRLGPPEPTFLEVVRWEHIPMGDHWFNEKCFVAVPSEPGREHLVLVTDFKQAWRSFFNLLAGRDAYPLLFHCSAGRDRTGVGALMLLELLRVERDRIVADFLESNAVFPRMLLEPSTLGPVFELIDRSGGIDGFMAEELGLEAAAVDAIRLNLLED